MSFDANTVEPNQGFEPLPAGEYEVIIIDSKMKPTKANTGRYLELTLQVLNGPFQNRQLWDRLNLFNPNDKAVQIAKGTLSAICRAIGVMTPKDSAELHNRPLRCRVVVTKDDKGNPSNEVKGYKPRGEQAAAPQQAAAPAAQAQQPVGAGVGGDAAPWAAPQ
jgi:hypothetical protein